jgi:hypothetical protein
MLAVCCMQWRVYTKLVRTANRAAMRWYWRKELPDGTEESPEGFTSRVLCEANALEHGCRPEDQAHERRTSMSRLFWGAEFRERQQRIEQSHR